MEWFEILIIIALVLFVLGVIFLNFYLKIKKGKSLGEDCDCAGNCSKCGHICSHKNGKSIIEEYHKSQQ